MSEDQQPERFQPRYQVLAYSFETVLHPKLEQTIRTAIHKTFQHELQLGGAAYSKQRDKNLHLYQTLNGLVAMDKTNKQGILFNIYCDTKLPYAEFKAGTLAYQVLRAVCHWVKPPMATLALADGKEVNDLVEVSVNYAAPGKHDPLTPGPLPLQHDNGSIIATSIERIKELEQQLIDEYLFENDGKTNVSVQTRIGTLWHANHGILPGLMPGVFPKGLEPRTLEQTLAFPITAARTGTDPPTGAIPSP